MQITNRQLAFHYAEQRALLREYFPYADPDAINEWITALRAFDRFPTLEAADRLAIAHRHITASVPIIEVEP